MRPKRILIRHFWFEDAILVKAAHRLGVEVRATCISDETDQLKKILENFKSIEMRTQKTGLQRGSSVWISSLINLIDTFLYKVRSGFPVEVRNPRYPGKANAFFILAALVPFLRPYLRFSDFRWDKDVYLKRLLRAGVPVPKIEAVLRDNQEPQHLPQSLTFPLICKPSLCSGGMGVMVAQSKADIERLYSYEENPQNFSDVNLYYRNRTKKGLRNYLYNSGVLGGHYFFQRFIPGRIFSISGSIIKGRVGSVFCNEIISYPNNFCAEMGFAWPIPGDIQSQITDLSQRMVRALDYPDGPFMADFVLDKSNKLYLIDAGPRCSLVAAQLSEYVFQDNFHAEALLASHWSEEIESDRKDSVGRPIFWQRFPFPKGRMKSIFYPSFERDEIIDFDTPIQAGDQVFEPRLDRQLAMRGTLVTTGSSLEEARSKLDQIYQECRWELETKE